MLHGIRIGIPPARMGRPSGAPPPDPTPSNAIVDDLGPDPTAIVVDNLGPDPTAIVVGDK